MKPTIMLSKLLTKDVDSWATTWAEKTKKDVKQLPSTWAQAVDHLLWLQSQQTRKPLHHSLSNLRHMHQNLVDNTSHYLSKSFTQDLNSKMPRVPCPRKLQFSKAMLKSQKDIRALGSMIRTQSLTPTVRYQNSHYEAMCAKQLEIKFKWTSTIRVPSVQLLNIYLSNCPLNLRKKNWKALDSRNVLENLNVILMIRDIKSSLMSTD